MTLFLRCPVPAPSLQRFGAPESRALAFHCRGMSDNVHEVCRGAKSQPPRPPARPAREGGGAWHEASVSDQGGGGAVVCVRWSEMGGPKIALQGGDGMGARRRGGGVPEMGFCAGPFVLCKDGCCHQRRRNTNFGPENFFHQKTFPHICVVKMISATRGSF